MKKYTVLLLTAALLCAGAANAQTDQFATAYELYEHWYSTQTDWTQSAYPDYVCGVWSTDGSLDHLTVAVLDNEAGKAGKAEILDAVADDSTLTFTTQQYSHVELLAIHVALSERLGDETGAYAIGVYEMDNKVNISIDTDNPNAQAFMEECYAKYGDRIVFEAGSGVFLTIEDSAARPETGLLPLSNGSGYRSSAALLLSLTVLFALFCVTLLLLAQRRRALQFADGHTVEADPSLSRSEVETALRNAQTAPPSDTLQKILTKIDE